MDHPLIPNSKDLHTKGILTRNFPYKDTCYIDDIIILLLQRFKALRHVDINTGGALREFPP